MNSERGSSRPDPQPNYGILQSCRTPSYGFFAFRFYEAAVRGLTRSAMTCRWVCRELLPLQTASGHLAGAKLGALRHCGEDAREACLAVVFGQGCETLHLAIEERQVTAIARQQRLEGRHQFGIDADRRQCCVIDLLTEPAVVTRETVPGTVAQMPGILPATPPGSVS